MNLVIIFTTFKAVTDGGMCTDEDKLLTEEVRVHSPSITHSTINIQNQMLSGPHRRYQWEGIQKCPDANIPL
jgi:hypothetical protein